VVFRRKLILLLLTISPLLGVEYYEGTYTFRGGGEVDYSWMVQLLPYNPVIVEAGAYTGDQALYAVKVWPHCRRVVAFEPNPKAFEQLEKRVAALSQVEVYNLALNSYKGKAPFYLNLANERESSLLPLSEEMAEMEVPCVVLDDFCREHQIEHIDILRLELEGLELQVLEGAQNILKNTHILILSSFFYPYRVNMVNYFPLKDFLTKSNFVPLAHWYIAGERGTAVYVSKEMYDAYFVRCLGLGLGGLLYP
jgi:FkbM family methyltransferase